MKENNAKKLHLYRETLRGDLGSVMHHVRFPGIH